MIRISITSAAFEAIAATLPLGSVGFEAEVNAEGERFVWLAPHVVDRLTDMRGRGESFSDVILRLVELERR
jgi:aconitase A